MLEESVLSSKEQLTVVMERKDMALEERDEDRSGCSYQRLSMSFMSSGWSQLLYKHVPFYQCNCDRYSMINELVEREAQNNRIRTIALLCN